MDRKEYDKLPSDQKIELFDLTDDQELRGHLFLSTGIKARIWFLDEKEPDPKEGPYIVLERLSPDRCEWLRVTAFADTGTILDSREVHYWKSNKSYILTGAELEVIIDQLITIAARTIKPGTARQRRQGRHLDPVFAIFRTIKVEDVMNLVEQTLEQERRTGRKITNKNMLGDMQPSTVLSRMRVGGHCEFLFLR